MLDNGFEGRRYSEYPDFLTLAERDRPALATFAALDWMPLAALEAGGAILRAEETAPYVSMPGADTIVASRGVVLRVA